MEDLSYFLSSFIREIIGGGFLLEDHETSLYIGEAALDVPHKRATSAGRPLPCSAPRDPRPSPLISPLEIVLRGFFQRLRILIYIFET